MGLKADGTVVATGSNSKGQCNVSGWAQIRIGGEADSALTQTEPKEEQPATEPPAPETEPTEAPTEAEPLPVSEPEAE